MKKLFIIICAFFVGFAHADNVITSKEYVDTQGAALQPQVPAKNTNTVLTYPAAGTDAPGEKAIYDASAAYATQSDALVTAGQFNNALQVALDTEFVCISRNDQGCLLYEIRSASQKQTLPAGYTQLEYIESTGTQYINTNIIPSSDGYHINTKMTFLSTPSTMGIFGYNYADNKGTQRRQSLGIATAGSGHTNRIVFGHSDGTIGFAYMSEPNIGVPYVINASYGPQQSRLTYNDEVISVVNNPTTRQNPQQIYLMNVNRVSTANNVPMIGRMYYATIWDTVSNNLLFNGIPVRRDSDGILGMYDLVSGAFFTNAGTGEFSAGPVFSYLPQGNQ